MKFFASVKFSVSSVYGPSYQRDKVLGRVYARTDAHHIHGTVERIFDFVHIKASHSNKVMESRWKNAERRILNRCKKRI